MCRPPRRGGGLWPARPRPRQSQLGDSVRRRARSERCRCRCPARPARSRRPHHRRAGRLRRLRTTGLAPRRQSPQDRARLLARVCCQTVGAACPAQPDPAPDAGQMVRGRAPAYDHASGARVHVLRASEGQRPAAVGGVHQPPASAYQVHHGQTLRAHLDGVLARTEVENAGHWDGLHENPVRSVSQLEVQPLGDHDELVGPRRGGLTADLLLFIVAIIGTTVEPWQLFFQQASIVDKRIGPRWIHFERADLCIGVVVEGCRRDSHRGGGRLRARAHRPARGLQRRDDHRSCAVRPLGTRGRLDDHAGHVRRIRDRRQPHRPDRRLRPRRGVRDASTPCAGSPAKRPGFTVSTPRWSSSRPSSC